MAVHVHDAIAKGDDGGGENPMEKMSEMFGPGHVGGGGTGDMVLSLGATGLPVLAY